MTIYVHKLVHGFNRELVHPERVMVQTLHYHSKEGVNAYYLHYFHKCAKPTQIDASYFSVKANKAG